MLVRSGYDASHAMAVVLLRDRIGEHGRILVLGAGGGFELSVFARECQRWTFTGVDPSVEMLRQANVKLETVGASGRVSWVQGTVENSPRDPLDAATAFLVLNFVEDDPRIYAAFARRNGAPEDVVQRAVRMHRESLSYMLPEREIALLGEAGFGDVRLFYTGLWVSGWIARA